MEKSIAAKLKSRAGESIGETLVALLISALALLMLAGAISAATRVVTQSRTAMTGYYAAAGNIEARTTTSRQINLTLTDSAASDPLNSINFAVDTYENNTIAAKPVIAYALHTD